MRSTSGQHEALTRAAKRPNVRYLFAFLALSVGLPLAAGADTPYAATNLTPQQLLVRAHHAEGSLGTHPYRMVDRTVTGDRTFSTQTVANGDDYLTTEHDGDFVTEDGSWHGTDWERNFNGVVVRMTDFAAQNDPFRQALRAPSAPSSGARVLGETVGPSPQYVLELRPQDALLEDRYYDAATYLLDRVETKGYDGRTRVHEFSDYRTFDGASIPRIERYHDGRPENDATTTVVSLDGLSSVDPASLAIPQSEKPFAFAGDAPVEVPATFTEDGIIVRLTIAGRGLDFVLDSGASGVAIDRATAQSLGLTLHGRNVATIGGDFSLSEARIPDVAIGSLHARDLAVDVIPFAAPVGDMKVVGLLGSDFFASGAVTVDFRNHRLAIAPKPQSIVGYSKIPLSIDDYVPMLSAAFNGKKGTFMADIGAVQTVLYPHYFAQFKAPDEPDSATLDFIGGPTGIKKYQISKMEFGDYNLEDVAVSIPSNRKVEDADYDGLLGRDILHYFTVIFDYPNQAMYVRPFDAQ